MATITAQTIVDRAEKTLLDETNVRWSPDELLDYLNEAQRTIVLSKPDAYSKNVVVQLVSGTKQSVPADCVKLVRVVRNMGTDGLTVGNIIRYADMESLDEARPDWHTQTASATAVNWLQNETDPKNFYVSPPQPAAGQGYIEIIYSASPPDVTLSDTISLDDIYSNIIYLLVMWRALSKEGKTQDLNKAQSYLSIATQGLGMKNAAEQSVQ